MCRWYLAYAYTGEQQGLLHLHSVLSHSCHLSLPQLRTLAWPPCKRKELQLYRLLSYRLRGAYMTRQKLYMSYLYLRDHLTQMYLCLSQGWKRGNGLKTKSVMILKCLPWTLSHRIPICITHGQPEPPRARICTEDCKAWKGGKKTPTNQPTIHQNSSLTSFESLEMRNQINFCFTCFYIWNTESQTRKLSLSL